MPATIAMNEYLCKPKQLKTQKKKINTLIDMLLRQPHSYTDRSQKFKINEIKIGKIYKKIPFAPLVCGSNLSNLLAPTSVM